MGIEGDVSLIEVSRKSSGWARKLKINIKNAKGKSENQPPSLKLILIIGLLFINLQYLIHRTFFLIQNP